MTCPSSLRSLFFLAVLSLTGCESQPLIIIGSEESERGVGDLEESNDYSDELEIKQASDRGTGDGDTDDNAGNAAVCGNSLLEFGELCDDANTTSQDGCSGDCLTVEADYLCIEQGQACVRVVTCGNGVIEGAEVCDDGNQLDDDGCSSDCSSATAGFSCFKPGEDCLAVAVCGNGLRERGEDCDDGQEVPQSGDGCSDTCQEEDAAAWFCPPGQMCQALVCGDGLLTPDEACDDGGVAPGDGCSSACEVETGWRCGTSGCRAICGDSQINGMEECDDGGLLSGDGCSSACRQEAFFNCTGSPSSCISTIVCGDGCIQPGEICDQGDLSNSCGDADASCLSNTDDPARACSAFTSSLNPGFCGDGVVDFNEECDGDCGSAGCNIDGCTACMIDAGYSCPRAGQCVRLPECGDGFIQLGEQCDVGATSSPACDASGCFLIANYYCSGEPSVCVDSVCGDGFVAPDEECDDGPGTTPGVPGVPVNGDGCSSSCTVETGFVCPPGLGCQPVCGNGSLEAGEECDESSTGCVNCFITAGYDCDAQGENCALTVCGSANTGAPVVERGEGCDDGNDIAGDGCSPTCQLEPQFSHSADGEPTNNTASCGDGFKTTAEGCDDGNITSGDGCSATCAVESGWTCLENTIEYPTSLDFQVTYRDFTARGTTNGHPHFKQAGNDFGQNGLDLALTGQICSTSNQSESDLADQCGALDSDGKPQHVKPLATTGVRTIIDYSSAFGLWYRDENSSNLTGENGVIQVIANPGLEASPGVALAADTITLSRVGSTTAYEFDSNSFFDLDGRGYGNSPNSHNYNFTTELRYFFQYQGGEELVFRGDDDVWVYVNGKLAVDLGGIHCPARGRVVLGDEDGSCNLQQQLTCSDTSTVSACSSYTTTEQADSSDGRFGLTKGNVYEIALFHAERQPSGSNFKLTLDGFLAPRSVCQTNCGDGIAAGNEICDTNSGLSDGYNTCLADCSIRFCGDGQVQNTNGGDEVCDTPVKVTYQEDGGGCGFDCQVAPFCGDGEIQASAGEVCDDGTNDGSYGSCATNCRGYGGYCGDDVTQTTNGGAEACDTTEKVSYQADGAGCGFDCQVAPYCGDGLRNGPETCEPPNTVECDSNCQVQPFCGDGIPSPTEECDDGQFNQPAASVGYGACTDACELGPRCGDGVTQDDIGEECDDAALNSDVSNPAYGSCTTACLLGPRCGDSITQDGEDCDNGYNDDLYAYSTDSCGANCEAVPYCGDGVVSSAIEQCDAGTENNDTAYDGCTTECLWGPFCGDGLLNGNEVCDDPNGNLAYSADGQGCSFECTKELPSCGDGIRNSAEECDEGADNNTGSYAGCRADCTRASYCGDGVIDDSEECDDGMSGSLSCTASCQERSDPGIR